MAGIIKNNKVERFSLNSEQLAKLFAEASWSKYKKISIGGICKILNSRPSNKKFLGFDLTKTVAESLLGIKGIIIEGIDLEGLKK